MDILAEIREYSQWVVLQGYTELSISVFCFNFWSLSFCSSVSEKVGLQGYFVEFSGFARLPRETAVQVYSEQP